MLLLLLLLLAVSGWGGASSAPEDVSLPPDTVSARARRHGNTSGPGQEGGFLCREERASLNGGCWVMRPCRGCGEGSGKSLGRCRGLSSGIGSVGEKLLRLLLLLLLMRWWLLLLLMLLLPLFHLLGQVFFLSPASKKKGG